MYRNTIKLLCDNHYNKYFPNGKKETFIYTNIDTKKIIDFFKKINKNKDFLLFYSCEMNIKSKKCDEKIKFSDICQVTNMQELIHEDIKCELYSYDMITLFSKKNKCTSKYYYNEICCNANYYLYREKTYSLNNNCLYNYIELITNSINNGTILYDIGNKIYKNLVNKYEILKNILDNNRLIEDVNTIIILYFGAYPDPVVFNRISNSFIN